MMWFIRQMHECVHVLMKQWRLLASYAVLPWFWHCNNMSLCVCSGFFIGTSHVCAEPQGRLRTRKHVTGICVPNPAGQRTSKSNRNQSKCTPNACAAAPDARLFGHRYLRGRLIIHISSSSSPRVLTGQPETTGHRHIQCNINERVTERKGYQARPSQSAAAAVNSPSLFFMGAVCFILLVCVLARVSGRLNKVLDDVIRKAHSQHVPRPPPARAMPCALPY